MTNCAAANVRLGIRLEWMLKLVSDKPPKATQTDGKPIECNCGSRATIEVRLNRTLKNGKITGGQKQIRCADCGGLIW